VGVSGADEMSGRGAAVFVKSREGCVAAVRTEEKLPLGLKAPVITWERRFISRKGMARNDMK
jgi:hypothetical protein